MSRVYEFKYDSPVIAFESESISIGYMATNTLLKSVRAHLIEASPIQPGRLFALVSIHPEDTEEAKEIVESLLKRNLFNLEVVTSMRKETLDAFYGLSSLKKIESLLVVESDSTSQLLSLANELVGDGLIQLMEIRSSRGLGNTSIMYASVEGEKRVLMESTLESSKGIKNYALLSELHEDLVPLFLAH